MAARIMLVTIKFKTSEKTAMTFPAKYGVQFENDKDEKLILKILLYMFYILIPTTTNITYTVDQRLNILYYCMNIYAYINNNNYILYCYEELKYLLNKSKSKKVNHYVHKKLKMLDEYIHYILRHV